MASLYRRKYDYLINAGFYPFEAREFARQYTIPQLKTTSYLRNMIRNRRLYVGRMKKRGLSDRQIRDRIMILYGNNDLLRGIAPDPWQWLKRFRKIAINAGKYPIPTRKGSHHKVKGVSKGDVVGQKKRSKQRRMQSELDDLERRWRKAISDNDQSSKRKIEREMDAVRRKYGL